MIDSHCHLNASLYGGRVSRDKMLKRAWRSGIQTMIAIGAGRGLVGAAETVTLAMHHPNIYASVGCHPLEIKEWSLKAQEAYWAMLSAPKVVAVGETGLDFYRKNVAQKLQEDIFYEQFLWARSKSLPLIIHDRASEGRTLALLEKWKAFENIGVLFHCFVGTVKQMERIVSKGGYISISGIVTFRNGRQVQEVAKSVPLERLLIETDSPFLAPSPHRGKRNEPTHLRHTAQKIAMLRGCDTDELNWATAQNSRRLFGVPVSHTGA